MKFITALLLTSFSLTTLAANHYQTKTPYQPQQDAKSYETPPAGYTALFTEMVARHGSRGLSDLKYDLAVENLLIAANKEQALTPKGKQLLELVQKIEQANLLLGYGVEGVSSPGYGNLTTLGIAEHKALATRLFQRHKELFSGQRTVLIETSGENRAIDSSKNFSASLKNHAPNLIVTMLGSNRYTLYFHKLNEDKSPAGDDLLKQQVLAASKKYQKYHKDNPKSESILKALRNSEAAKTATQAILAPLFTPEFLAKIGSEGYQYTNDGERQATSADGQYHAQAKGNGKEKIKTAFDAAAMIYELYIIAPNMVEELNGANLNRFVPENAAAFFNLYKDTDYFYDRGPGFSSEKGITSAHAQALLYDFFQQAINAQKSDAPAAALRFAHAETMIPFATLLAFPGSDKAQADDTPYRYENNDWRGATISPMAANIQWDIYNNAENKPIVRMLVNEKETLFKESCNTARINNNSYYYYLYALKDCYLSN